MGKMILSFYARACQTTWHKRQVEAQTEADVEERASNLQSRHEENLALCPARQQRPSSRAAIDSR
jgi:hypothetical protein